MVITVLSFGICSGCLKCLSGQPVWLSASEGGPSLQSLLSRSSQKFRGKTTSEATSAELSRVGTDLHQSSGILIVRSASRLAMNILRQCDDP